MIRHRPMFMYVCLSLAALCLLWTFWPTPAQAGEVALVKKLAPKFGAEVEVRLPDGTRADMLTATHAYEVDWARKWAEAVGQTVYYGLITGRQPAIVLLVKDFARERRYIFRCRAVCHHLNIELHTALVRDIEHGE